MNTQRFVDFVSAMDVIVERSGTDEAALLNAAESALTALIAHDDWLPDAYAVPSPSKYQQYLLYVDARSRYSVQSFVWAPGQGTPIHNHTVWGLVGVLRGAEQCSEYPVPGGAAMQCKHEHRLERGHVDRVSPTVGDWHSVSNAFSDQPSLSIHVYGADIGRVERRVFDPVSQSVKPFVSGYSNETAWIGAR